MNVMRKIIHKWRKFFNYSEPTDNHEEVWCGRANYWDRRYERGGNSGAGSYHRLAEYKAEILNGFVTENNVKLVIEWGCGDGNQLSYANYPDYVGIDVSSAAIDICKAKFQQDKHKSFFWSGVPNFQISQKGDLAISLDVIYHLVEDSVFEQYMRRLFDSSLRFVVIYSCDDEIDCLAPHVKHRCFSKWIEKNEPNWTLMKTIKNKFPYDESDPDNTSWSDFFFYRIKAS